MGRESSLKPPYEILAYVTTKKDRVLTGSPLALYAENEEVQLNLISDIANALKADIVKLKTGDFMVIRV